MAKIAVTPCYRDNLARWSQDKINMAIVVTGDKGSGKTSYVVNKILYPAWKSGIDICSNTLLFFETAKNRCGTNIINNPKGFNLYERSLWIWRKFLLKTYRLFFKDYNQIYNPQEPHFFHRAKVLLHETFWNWLQYVPSRGQIMIYEELSEVIHKKDCIKFLDEGNDIDARDWEDLADEIRKSARQDRKKSVTFVITTQEMGQIDKTYRRLIQEWVECSPGWPCIGADPVWFGRFKAEWLDIGAWTKTETANTNIGTNKQRVVQKTAHWWISAFFRRKYNSFFMIGFNALKTICFINGSTKQRQWAIVNRSAKTSEIEREMSQYFRKPAKSTSPIRRYASS